MCKTKQNKGSMGASNRVNMIESEEEYKDEYAFTVGTKRDGDKGSVDITVDGVTLPKMLIDSGATCNVLNTWMWNDLKMQGVARELKGTTQNLQGATAM